VTDTVSSCSNEENTKYSDAKLNWMRDSVLGTIRRTVCYPVLQLFKGCNLSSKHWLWLLRYCSSVLLKWQWTVKILFRTEIVMSIFVSYFIGIEGVM